MSESFPQRILCPVDFSNVSAAGLRFAARLAGCGPAQITLLHAHYFEAPAYFTGEKLDQIVRQFRESLKDAELALRDFGRLAAPDVDSAAMVQEGPPAETILGAARTTLADLIVMGTHGRSGVSRVALGSVAERVLRESPVPVLTVHPDKRTATGSILCAVNETPAARKALEYAARLAVCTKSRLTVLNVQETGAPATEPECAGLECDLRKVSRRGHAAEEILRLAGELNPDLLVIGGQRRLLLDIPVLGATTVRVVRHAPCPVLTVMNG